MQLNADIVYSALREQYPVKMMGPKTTEMTISRPELYLDNEEEFLSDHLYLATVDHLPLHPKIQKNVVVVVIGEGARLSHYRENCCLIVIRDKVDFFGVNQYISRLFDRYYAWEKKLFDIFLDSADLQQIVDCSYPIFGRDIHVLDASFHFLAHSGTHSSPNSLELEMISEYLASFELITEKHGATILELSQTRFLCINLYDRKDTYIGCTYIEGNDLPFQEGEIVLAEFMARLMEKAIEKNPAILTNEQTTVKNALVNLVNEYPLTASQKWKLNLSNYGRRFVCISLHSANRLSQLPKGYICGAFESEFPNAIVFPKENSIVCFLDVDSIADKNGDYHVVLNSRLKKFLAETCEIAGISNSFTNLFNARIGYAQAEVAIENGMITNSETELFYFQTYALISMIINSMGNLPSEAYFSERLQNLIQHDKTAPVSYLDTLRVFLRNSQSYSQTAEELYIHRSTVVDRITRIERELDVDLKDPDTRLQLEIILKAMEIEKMVQQARE